MAPRTLIGKRVAISDIRSSPYYFARAGFKKLNLDEKQVTLATTGGTSNSFAALTSNQVAGAVLSPPFDDKAVSLGYKKFLFLGDLADIPTSGYLPRKRRSELIANGCAKPSPPSWTRLPGSGTIAAKR